METRARKLRNGDYVITGSKTWITNASIADIMIVWAKDDDDHIRGFILDRHTMKGISTPLINGKMSLKASVTGQIFLDEVVVSESFVLPKAKGLSGPFRCLNSARYGISWGSLGNYLLYYCVCSRQLLLL